MPELLLPDPPLAGDSVSLRAWPEADVSVVVAVCQDPGIARWSPVIPPSPSYGESDVLEWLAGQQPARHAGRVPELAVTNSKSGVVSDAVALSNVDLSQLRSGVAYWLAPEARGHGYASRGRMSRPSQASPVAMDER